MGKIYFLAALLLLGGCWDGTTATVVKETKQAERPSQTGSHVPKVMGSVPAKTDVLLDGLSPSAMLDVSQINQQPELKYGCEVTSLAMVLNHAGIKVGKMELYRAIKKDNDPLVRSGKDIKKWGNPAEGFVGDMTGYKAGYAVFDQPLADLADAYLPGRIVNLTNKPFETILAHVSRGFPVVVWTTGDFKQPDRWEAWMHQGKQIKTPLDLHAVVLVGYDRNHVYINDPLSGKKQFRVERKMFHSSWVALKRRAVSYQ